MEYFQKTHHLSMIFNSLYFLVFIVCLFSIYWGLQKHGLQKQNILLLLASYFFYACWDWRFLFLLMFSTLLDFYSALRISNADSLKKKKVWFWLSILINLGFLGIFKYYNFFVDSFVTLFLKLGYNMHSNLIEVILPVGISFYTFHGLSYVIDVFNNKIKAEKNIIHYSLFVCFFPLLVAGPIERATHLLPQVKVQRFFKRSDAVDGLKQILWGLFKKIVIADNCAQFANIIFDDYNQYSGSTLALGALFFAFQIYGDFSGYSDIALGTARLFGFKLLRNFAYPYFSRDIAEFWRRWHISLSTWFKDYLYIPLGGSKGSDFNRIRNTFIIFLVSGFWHGANWTFIVWGLLHAIYIAPSIIFATNRKNIEIVAQGKKIPSIRELLSMIITFCLVTFAWIFFRAPNLQVAFQFVKKMFAKNLFAIPYFSGISLAIPILILIVFFMIVEWSGRENQYAIQSTFTQNSKILRQLLYYSILVLIFLFAGSNQQFIYFQF